MLTSIRIVIEDGMVKEVLSNVKQDDLDIVIIDLDSQDEEQDERSRKALAHAKKTFTCVLS